MRLSFKNKVFINQSINYDDPSPKANIDATKNLFADLCFVQDLIGFVIMVRRSIMQQLENLWWTIPHNVIGLVLWMINVTRLTFVYRTTCAS
jgi:hypothetical protein